jgi:hypothetical protein
MDRCSGSSSLRQGARQIEFGLRVTFQLTAQFALDRKVSQLAKKRLSVEQLLLAALTQPKPVNRVLPQTLTVYRFRPR